MHQPVLHKKHSLSPIWILPLVALGLGLWLMYTSYRDAGVTITVHFATAEGITAGKTVVMYKGIPVGLVKEMRVDDDLRGVMLVIEMERRCQKALASDSTFWIVKPEVSAGRVQGLDTIFSGSYIQVLPGTSEIMVKHFAGLAEPPTLGEDTPGLRIILESEALNSLQKGSHVYLKDIRIGQVENYHLTPENKIAITVHIEQKYAGLITASTRFWNVSGFTVGGDIQGGFNFQIESLASLMYGGIACDNPPTAAPGEPVRAGQRFALYANHNSAEFGLPLQLRLPGGMGLVEGKSKVMYRGLQVGTVKKLQPEGDDYSRVVAEILLDPRAGAILTTGTKFWVIRPSVSLEGLQNLETLVTGAYITFAPGSGPFCDQFRAQTSPLPKEELPEGVRYVLQAADKGTLEVGSPLYHRKIQVGEITALGLAKDLRSVRCELLVYRPYASLITAKTIFWHTSGVSIDASLAGLKLEMAPLKGLLVSGIAFATPPAAKKSRPARAESTFTLYASHQLALEAFPTLREPGLLLRLRATSPSPITDGAPVLYHGIRVGEVLGTRLEVKSGEGVVDILLPEEFAPLANDSSRFYFTPGFSLNADLSGVEVTAPSLEAVLSGGIAFFTPEKSQPLTNGSELALYESDEAARHAGQLELTIRLREPLGLTKNTKIKYQGVEIGAFTSLDFSPDFKEIIGHALVRRDATQLFRATTTLQVIESKLDFSGVAHLDALVSGSYLEVIPGHGRLRTDFALTAPAAESKEGLAIVLEAQQLGSLRKNSPIYYRQILVGRVLDYGLSPTAQAVWIRVVIMPRYQPLVRRDSKFWLASGVQLSGGIFSEFQVQTQSLEALMRGGIALATPEQGEMGGEAQDGDHFLLHPDAEKEWLAWRPVIALPHGSQHVAQPVAGQSRQNGAQGADRQKKN